MDTPSENLEGDLVCKERFRRSYERWKTCSPCQLYCRSYITWSHYKTSYRSTEFRHDCYNTVSRPLNCVGTPFWHLYVIIDKYTYSWRRLGRKTIFTFSFVNGQVTAVWKPHEPLRTNCPPGVKNVPVRAEHIIYPGVIPGGKDRGTSEPPTVIKNGKGTLRQYPT